MHICVHTYTHIHTCTILVPTNSSFILVWRFLGSYGQGSSQLIPCTHLAPCWRKVRRRTGVEKAEGHAGTGTVACLHRALQGPAGGWGQTLAKYSHLERDQGILREGMSSPQGGKIPGREVAQTKLTSILYALVCSSKQGPASPGSWGFPGEIPSCTHCCLVSCSVVTTIMVIPTSLIQRKEVYWN